MKIQRTLLSFALTLVAAAGILVPMGQPQSAKASSVDTPVLERSEGYTLRFKANPNAAQYVINDETDYRNGLILTNDDADSNGFIYYTTETVGEHNVTVDAYVNGNVLTSNEVTVTNDPVFFYGAPTSLFFHDVTNNEAGKYSILQEDGTYKTIKYVKIFKKIFGIYTFLKFKDKNESLINLKSDSNLATTV